MREVESDVPSNSEPSNPEPASSEAGDSPGRGPDQEITTLIARARQAMDQWEVDEFWQLEEDCDRQALAESLVEKMVKLADHPRATRVLVDWILDQPGVADLFADDAQVEQALRVLVSGVGQS